MGEYVETRLDGGGVIVALVNPAPTKTHKTSGLSCSEYRSLFTLNERILNDKTRTNIDADLSFLRGSVSPDDIATALGLEHSYRDILRTVYKSFDDATEVDTRSDEVGLALRVQAAMGLLDGHHRIEQIRLGIES
jgi:hypothetical protein